MVDERNPEPAPMAQSAGPRVHLVTDGGMTRADCRRVVSLIGSREGCKVRLRHPQVAPVHAAIINNGSQVLAIDLGSRSGTLLNGLKVDHEQLSDGDVLSIGSWEFHVELEEAGGETHSDVHPFALEPSPHAVALEHIESGRILSPNRDVCTIGRRSSCDIVVPDERVSRVQALLLNYFGHPALCDLLGRNQTRINDEPVSFQMIQNGDIITLGSSQFRVRLVGSKISEAPSKPRKDAPKTVHLNVEDHPPDEISIEETESSQRWRIADKPSGKRASTG